MVRVPRMSVDELRPRSAGPRSSERSAPKTRPRRFRRAGPHWPNSSNATTASLGHGRAGARPDRLVRTSRLPSGPRDPLGREDVRLRRHGEGPSRRWPTDLTALLRPCPETPLAHGDRSISIDLRLNFAQASAVLINGEAWHHPRDGFQAPSKSADVAYDLDQGRRGVFDDAEARAFELAGQPPGPTTFRIGLRTFDAEERPVLEIVARVDLLGNEPPSREENARDLADVEALMSIHDQMERFVREGKRRSGAFHGLSGVVPRRCDLDDVNAEGSQTRASDSDVRSPGLGGDGPR